MDSPKYPTEPFYQPVIYDENDIAVGFRVGIRMNKNDVIHEESVDEIVGEERTRELRNGSIEDYTAWSFSVLEKYDLVGKANKALDAI